MIPNKIFNMKMKIYKPLHSYHTQGELAGKYKGHCVTERGHWWPEEGAVDADYSLSLPKTICAW